MRMLRIKSSIIRVNSHIGSGCMENNKVVQKWRGVVVSDKMAKTIVVRVDRRVSHPKYKKAHTVSRKYKVHDENKKYKVGDMVTFIGCRPMSRDKRWRVI